jgi:predicted PurR-regulated permease PerM
MTDSATLPNGSNTLLADSRETRSVFLLTPETPWRRLLYLVLAALVFLLGLHWAWPLIRLFVWIGVLGIVGHWSARAAVWSGLNRWRSLAYTIGIMASGIVISLVSVSPPAPFFWVSLDSGWIPVIRDLVDPRYYLTEISETSGTALTAALLLVISSRLMPPVRKGILSRTSSLNCERLSWILWRATRQWQQYITAYTAQMVLVWLGWLLAMALLHLPYVWNISLLSALLAGIPVFGFWCSIIPPLVVAIVYSEVTITGIGLIVAMAVMFLLRHLFLDRYLYALSFDGDGVFIASTMIVGLMVAGIKGLILLPLWIFFLSGIIGDTIHSASLPYRP